ncbi:GNAT family N-acetyltransferase [Paenibacillus guangzhouensis]|uniref:GNAT family N-acetyltransferase n=1 Tax=Paenibacillus guangzhouensis TaxID=1473112 RepID=UPI00126725E3|nr:GNAT family N-acetyltransferase [Paenibacillus guangzhouensis]
MVDIRVIRSPQEDKWPVLRAKFTQFIINAGDQRITVDAIKQFGSLSLSGLQADGTQLIIATERTLRAKARLIGLAFVENYGDTTCLVVVHPDYRGQRIGTKLLQEQINQLGNLTCTVAMDNLSSLHMCFQAGLTAYTLIEGPTGKPTLAFEYDARR